MGAPDAARAQRERAKRALESLRGGLQRSGSFSGSGERSDACFDWSRGSCARGESCRFAHDGPAGGNPLAGNGRIVGGSRASAGVCFDHAKGTCKRGDLCRFSHDVAAVAAFAKVASPSGSTSGSPTNGRVGGAVNIPKPLPIAGALNAALRSAVAKEPPPTPPPIAQRSGAIDYASAAKAGVAGAAEGSFAAALVGKKTSADSSASSTPSLPNPTPVLEKTPALTASGASVPAPRFPTPNGVAPMPASVVNDTVLEKPAYQFGTGSMLAGDYAADAAAGQASGNGLSLGSKASATAPKQYPKPEFAFGTGAVVPPVDVALSNGSGDGFVPPVPAGPPPEANQRPQVTPGFGFAQAGFGIALPEKSTPQANVWSGHAQLSGVVNGAGADGSSQLESEWDVSGMGMEGLVEDYSKLGAYDALGGGSPFSVGLGYSLFTPAVPQQHDGAGYQAQGQPQNLWGSHSSFSGYGGF